MIKQPQNIYNCRGTVGESGQMCHSSKRVHHTHTHTHTHTRKMCVSAPQGVGGIKDIIWQDCNCNYIKNRNKKKQQNQDNFPHTSNMKNINLK